MNLSQVEWGKYEWLSVRVDFTTDKDVRGFERFTGPVDQVKEAVEKMNPQAHSIHILRGECSKN